MAKKGKKRQLNENEATDNNPIVKTTNDVGNKDSPKKKKLKTNAGDAAVTKTQEVKVANNVNGAENASKKSKKKKNKKAQKQENSEESASEKPKPVQNNAEKTEVPEEDGVVANSKRKEKLKQKRKENKELRKEVRKEEGNFSSVNKLSVEEMKKKIAEIEARETQSKTAIRKLRILKKKLSIEEGTIDTTPAQKRKGEAVEDSASGQKNKKFKKDVSIKMEKKEKNKEQINAVQDESKLNTPNKLKKDKQVAEQSLFIEDRVGNKPEKSNKKKSKDSGEEESEVSRAKKILEQVLNEKKQKAKKVKVQNDDDEENSENDEEPKKLAADEDDDDDEVEDKEDDEDDEDDDVEDSNEEDTATKINKSKTNVKADKKLKQVSADDEDDDDEDDDDEVTNEKAEVEEKNKTQQTSVKEKEKKEKPKDFNKQKPNQMNQNAGVPKKQRYVLFVGNLSYDATTVDIKKHFLTKVDIVKDVRIPTKPGTNTPRGFAYVELENSTDYEKALSLHDTFINGRKINVQYTSSGSKHSGNKQEIVHKNKKLHAMRKAGMLAGSKKTFQKRSFRRNSDRNSKTES
ncbi:uncharacterized protein DDB_G0283697 [Nasonia vitripennis]|uniref:RRM domain-containing protein n=1 Tax=Nasonia vitripennis TaxID=7425 RepID=A0A7M7H1Y0_NASVI|nr:uncharacterized protein DDB_G0283697 [Nasonia vitripennis]